jgi:hypothetical protein
MFRASCALIASALPIVTATAQTASPQETQLAPPTPFVIPWNDSSKTPIDVSFLNDAPAGKNGHLIARGEHFVESKTGRRVRLLGVVWTFTANFPEKAEADAVAARLAKYGVNAVRLHFFDGPPPPSDSKWKSDSIWKSPGVIDPAQLDRLEYLIAQFKKHGIYTNVNLKVARDFMPEEGLPAAFSQAWWADKPFDYFNPRMIELQKIFARQLLTHVNPYTGLSMANDPAIYTVEINNENTISDWDEGAKLLRLTGPLRGEAQSVWNAFLHKKYGSTNALMAAWGDKGELGAELCTGGWSIERRDPVMVTQTAADGVTQVTVENADGVGWHAQLKRTGLNLIDGQTYTLSFRACSDRAQAAVPIAAMRDVEDWRNVGLRATIAVSTDWQPYRLVFTARETVADNTRLVIELGALAGRLEIADVSLRAGVVPPRLEAGQSLEARTIPLPPLQGRYGMVANDWREFMFTHEQSYTNEMRSFLKNDLKVGAMVVNSQINYGIVSGTYRERVNDYADFHAYHDHPQNPVKGWDPVGAIMINTPMTPEVAGARKDTIGALIMRYRLAGKPFSISEYNHPAPNEYAVETLPLMATLAARQDFDALLLHEYGSYGPNLNTSKIQAYFAVGSDPSKWAFMPSSALLYRRGVMPPATRILHTSIPAEFSPQQTIGPDKIWKDADLKGAALNAQTRLHFGDVPKEATPYAVDGAKVQLTDAETPRAVFSASAPGALVISGAVANRTFSLGSATLRFGAAPNNFAALTLVSYDELPLAETSRALLTVMARARNTGQTWREDRKALTSWGTSPVLVDNVPVTVSLPVSGARRVFALDETGQIKAPVKATFADGKLSFSVSPSQGAVWYLIQK